MEGTCMDTLGSIQGDCTRRMFYFDNESTWPSKAQMGNGFIITGQGSATRRSRSHAWNTQARIVQPQRIVIGNFFLARALRLAAVSTIESKGVGRVRK
eukprot:2864230-Karenia_brevis.AAC.1